MGNMGYMGIVEKVETTIMGHMGNLELRVFGAI